MYSLRCVYNGEGLDLEQVLISLRTPLFINILRAFSHCVLKGSSSFAASESFTLKTLLLPCLKRIVFNQECILVQML